VLRDSLEVAPADAIARAVADEIAELVRERHARGRTAVLALPAGSTPKAIYAELARRRREERLCFDTALVFALDEYQGLSAAHPRSFRRYFEREVLGPLGVPPENAHLLAGDLHPDQVEGHCLDYERAIEAAGGIDLALLGLGANGHIAFNEPGSAPDSRTRAVTLHPDTRELAAPAFGGLARVPLTGLTIGLATLREARAVRLVATGAAKRAILERLLACRAPTAELPASALAGHPDLALYADPDAAQARGSTPPGLRGSQS
jgi:glucosamine-6-phosphate deaminase